MTKADAPSLGAHVARDRTIITVEGSEAESFLEGLLTNKIADAGRDAPVYAALLTPQGKFLADALVWRPAPERFLLDAPASLAPDLMKRLTLYKLRAAVTLSEAPELGVLLVYGDGAEAAAGETDAALGAVAAGADPRHAALGWRLIGPADGMPEAAARLAVERDPSALEAAWERRRIEAGVPAAGSDLRPNDGYILEYGFERLSGVDFRKGCFVGQEIVARMKHKAELKKGLFRVVFDGPAPPPGAEILADGKPAGVVGSSEGALALALMRIDRAGLPGLSAEGVAVASAERAAPTEEG